MSFMLLNSAFLFADQKGTEIVRKANDQLRGKSSIITATLTVIKPNWTRSISMKIWSLEPDYALILITKPARDKGTITLKRKREVWNWLPSIRRMIKIPPSMMLQPWMGSDFTNDDLVRESSIVEDYTHTIIGEEKIGGYDCYKIRFDPKPEAGVVWGKIIAWITKKNYLELKAEYYDEDGQLIKSMLGSKIKKMGGRLIPSYWEMIPQNKKGHKTIIEYHSIKFNVKIDPSFFSQQNMKRIR
ncbi:MAG: outer membrane lipoprotein-sorting protein [Calditrichaeota bacterium]|nr:outer membrane lipoprotein-sorting protein [Calditrichota bacterium]